MLKSEFIRNLGIREKDYTITRKAKGHYTVTYKGYTMTLYNMTGYWTCDVDNGPEKGTDSWYSVVDKITDLYQGYCTTLYDTMTGAFANIQNI